MKSPCITLTILVFPWNLTCRLVIVHGFPDWNDRSLGRPAAISQVGSVHDTLSDQRGLLEPWRFTDRTRRVLTNGIMDTPMIWRMIWYMIWHMILSCCCFSWHMMLSWYMINYHVFFQNGVWCYDRFWCHDGFFASTSSSWMILVTCNPTHILTDTLWEWLFHSYWKLWFVVDLAIENCNSP